MPISNQPSGAFDDEDVIHVDGDVNPVRDLETIGEELRLKDEEQLLKDLEKLERVVGRGNDKKLKPEYVSITTSAYQSIYLRPRRGPAWCGLT